jgi:two-component system CheB/CheR fusion protein
MPKKSPQSCIPLEPAPNEPEPTLDTLIPIVGIGASAGGLEAFEQFFRKVSVDSGIAYVLVSHLDPDHESMLADILGRVTKMPVIEAQDLMTVDPDHVYIIPPNREMAIFHRKIQLIIPDSKSGQQMKIDHFFRSLAQEQGDKAIGIIFSGTGTDGTLGLRAIQGGGGVTIVQDPAEAKYDGMPTSAINSGYATFILPIDQMPDHLISCVRNLFGSENFHAPASAEFPEFDKKGATSRILRIIRSKTGHDFSQYKKSTIHRRISRRMSIHGIDDIAIYVRYLEEHLDEVDTLFRELLINVTSFFRDPEAFDALKHDIIPELIKKRGEYEAFRVWVPGCSTGEEAYSLAIIIREVLDELGQDCKVQIYSTDIAEDVIAVARKGIYPPNIAADVSAERLKKFFIRNDAGFQVKKEIREMVIYATQNVIKDPPFTRLDLLSCRNLLIYLESELQARLISAFHYALKPGGILFLSSSESIGSCPDLFRPKNRKWKIYEASGIRGRGQTMMETPQLWADSHPKPLVLDNPSRPDTNLVEMTRRALLQTYAPPSVVTDEEGNILYVHGDTGKFLRPAQGQATLSVIEMAREGLNLDLRTAIFTAKTQKIMVTCKNLQVRTNGGFEGVDLEVRPIANLDSIPGGLIISFLLLNSPDHPDDFHQKRKVRGRISKPERVMELEQELQYTRENLQATVEEMQAANEELKSTNEELQSTNEELQSTNEELETSREELQSVNEEVMTVNAELQAKIEQLTVMQNDMKNLMSSTGIGTIFLDIDLAIRRFTPEATKIYKLVPFDVGRSLADIKSMIIQDTLLEEAQSVLDSLIPQEKEVQGFDNRQYVVRIMPYRTLDNVIDGIVLTFIDITSRKIAEEEAILNREYAESIVDTVREPLLVLDSSLTVVSANRSYFRIFQTMQEEIVGRNLTEIEGNRWNIPEIISILQKILPEKTSFEDLEVNLMLPEIGKKTFILNAQVIPEKNRESSLILLAMEEKSD